MTDDAALYDYEKCRRWREANRYTRRQLSDLTGFSESSINDFENGFVKGDNARPVSAAAMRRYRLTLAAVANGLADWDYTDA